MKHAYGYFPAIFRHNDGSSAHNSALGITINPEHPIYAAQLAQERYEYANRLEIYAYLLPFGLAAGLAAYEFLIPLWPVVILAMALTTLLYFLPVFVKPAEIMGHTIESVAASKFYGTDLNLHLASEARTLHRKYSYFRNDTPEQIEKRMRSKLDDAEEWVYEHSPTIARDLEKAKEHNS